jgi:hypothetical protein
LRTNTPTLVIIISNLEEEQEILGHELVVEE